jgi:hypothetical protein
MTSNPSDLKSFEEIIAEHEKRIAALERLVSMLANQMLLNKPWTAL